MGLMGLMGLMGPNPSYGNYSKPFSEEIYIENLELLIQTTNHEKFSIVLSNLRDNPTHELKSALTEKMNGLIEIDSAATEDTINEISKIISSTVDVFLQIGSRDELPLLDRLRTWLYHNYRDHTIYTNLNNKLYEATLTLLEVGSRELPSINELLQDQSRALVPFEPRNSSNNFNGSNDFFYRNQKITLKQKINQNTDQNIDQNIKHEFVLNEAENLLANMKKNVIEQNEILKVLQTLFIQDAIQNGQRTKPEVLYLMGLPGTGKDTIAEAYVDALWQKEDAHKEHMFRMNIRNKEEIWSYLGSPKGYIGSHQLPAFLRFLVKHSDSKYQIAKVASDHGVDRNGGGVTIIEKNPEWSKNSFGITPPKTVVFINEAHNIPKNVKDNIFKQAIERGIFPVNNPGSTPNSVSYIELPVTFIFSSNEGIHLLEPREKNGTRIGNPLTYDELIENYHRIKNDKDKLKQAIIEHNGEKNNPVLENAPGTSEEFLSRIPSNRIHILKPISPKGLKAILRIFEKDFRDKLNKARGAPIGPFDIQLSEKLITFLTSYNSIPSDGARPLENRLNSLIFEPFYQSILNRRIGPDNQNFLTINIDLIEYENNAKSLDFKIFKEDRKELTEESKPSYKFTRLIAQTLNDRPKQAISDQEVEEILALREKITSEVFGVEHIVDRLIEAVITSESESRNRESKRSATVMAFLGKTSTGKSELAKQYVMARYGEDQLPTIIDFNGIRDLGALKAKILGTVDSRNNPIDSDFMKAYDKSNGKFASVFDEFANSPKELLKAFYEIFREPVVTGFSDGKPRPMKDVTIIVTGNAGEQIYQNIPTGISNRSYAQAMEEIFELFIKNKFLQTEILTQTFPEALLARIGRNIFHFGPLSNKSKRQIAQLKLVQGLARLLPKPSERGWHIQFASKEDLLSMFHMIEIESYDQAYQGASIDKFVKEAIIDAIKAKLLASGFRNNSRVILSVGDFVEPKNSNIPPSRTLTLTSEVGKEITINIELERRNEDLPGSTNLRLLTVFHEVGHEIVSQYYFHDIYEPTLLKILPGVSIIDGELVVYAGLRVGRSNQQFQLNKETFLRKTAVLTGGYTAEQILTIGNRHDTGKSDDIKRATLLIQHSILKWGLSDRWNKQAVPSDISISDYIDKHLSEREKEKLYTITQEWLKEAEEMATIAIVSNLDRAFYSLSYELAKKGELSGNQIQDIYDRSKFVYNVSKSRSSSFDPVKAFKDLRSLLTQNQDRLLKKYSISDLTDFSFSDLTDLSSSSSASSSSSSSSSAYSSSSSSSSSSLSSSSSSSFYEKAFNDLSSWSTDLISKFLGKQRRWDDLNRHEQLMAKVILISFFVDRNLEARFFFDSNDPNEPWQFHEILDADAVLKDKQEKEKEGVLQMSNFKIYQSAEAAQTVQSDEAAKPSQSNEAAQAVRSDEAAKPSQSNEAAQAVRSAPLTCGSILFHPRL